MDSLMDIYVRPMGRRKKYATQLGVRVNSETLEAIQEVLGENEDVADLIRAGLTLELAMRRAGLYADFKTYLMGGETIPDFCIRSARMAIEERKNLMQKLGAPDPGGIGKK